MNAPESHDVNPKRDAVAEQRNALVSTQEMDWQEYAFFRDELRHEDNLINQRVSWLIGSQAFLLGGFATLLNSGGSPVAASLSDLRSMMVTGLPIAGILAVFAGYVTILAAVMHVRGIRRLLATRRYKTMPPLHNWHVVQLRMGLSGPLVTPLIFVGFWIIILAELV
jgi:hypothetical protein